MTSYGFMIFTVAITLSTATTAFAAKPVVPQYIATITQNDYTGVNPDSGRPLQQPKTEAQLLRRSRMISDVRFVTATEVVVQFNQSDVYGKKSSADEMNEIPSDIHVFHFASPDAARAFGRSLVLAKTQSLVVVDETKGVESNGAFYRDIFAGGGMMWNGAEKRAVEIGGLVSQPAPQSSGMSRFKSLFQ